MEAICRTCRLSAPVQNPQPPCPNCGGRRWLSHPELPHLHIAHIDCDAFYAAVEKRERPEWADRPVIVGGRARGVVTTACYVARLYGVKSAMPMYTALAKCPHALVVKPRMGLYRQVGLEIRDAMRRLSPQIQPLSIDEAYVDLSASQRLHGQAPYEVLLAFQDWVATHMGLTLSVGLAHNKLLAKIASDLEKPKGFSVLGPKDGAEFLTDQPVRILWGVGPALAKSLARRGILTVGDLRRFSEAELSQAFGSLGPRLADFARGHDPRPVRSDRISKSISSETTFHRDLSALGDLEPILTRLAGRVASRVARARLQGWTLTLKLKTHAFQTFTRRQKLPAPTDAQDLLREVGLTLLRKELPKGPFRLMGLGLSDFARAADFAAPPQSPLLN